ncbi:hypothetical protein ACFYYD_04130 [Streptomyces bluensis]|uniref:hypothetical protein n=1 Tax=Streptomyces bluensis TaxID=33897 RepID=UPI00367BD24F
MGLFSDKNADRSAHGNEVIEAIADYSRAVQEHGSQSFEAKAASVIADEKGMEFERRYLNRH